MAPLYAAGVRTARGRTAALAALLGLVAACFVCAPAPPAAAAAAAGPDSTWPTVARGGVRTNNVMSIQYLLTARGIDTTADASFGPQTEESVKAFQRSAGLAASGVVRKGTWKRLVLVFKQGAARKTAVLALQSQLNKYHYNVFPDGDFGPRTTRALKAFQRSRGLKADGVARVDTWRHLTGYAQTYDQTRCYYTAGTSSPSSLNVPQKDNVRQVLAAGRAVGANRAARIISLMVVLQEAKLCNVQFGHSDSVGLYQQRIQYGWCPGGSACISPSQSTRSFYGRSSQTDNRGLFDIAGWQSMPKWKAAQAVQASCCPQAYAKWQPLATQLVDAR